MQPSSVNALVVGQGSIGQRHARLLRDEGCAVSIVSAHEQDAYQSLDKAFIGKSYDYVVISNETSKHFGTIAELKQLGFRGRLLVEKPIFAVSEGLFDERYFEALRVAYNLRFHPIVQRLRERLVDSHPFQIRVHVGQHLADWRPGKDYRSTSSALRSAGGGVLRDLSHELDLIAHLFGPWERLVSVGGNLGLLDIETDEVWNVLMILRQGAVVSLTLNYLDRPPERRIVVNTANGMLSADLIGATTRDEGGRIEAFEVDRDQTYRDQHRAMLSANYDLICTADEGLEVMRTIEAIERSAREQRWIDR